MQRNPIPIFQFLSRPFDLSDKGWLLLACGDFSARDYNCMTISWGSLGFVWGRPFAQVFVRPQRYTYQFMEKYPTFTLSAFTNEYRQALDLLGGKSGRDSDKLAEAGLTPVAASSVAAPCFVEAELVIECRKIYWSDFDPTHFIDQKIDRNYPTQDYHRNYFGEILAISGAGRFAQNA
ncbi:MAG: flavin reductase family protein [Chloroflexota bacterium]|nr:MAG: flavin reductase family protein [Chloroflexota bacterium]